MAKAMAALMSHNNNKGQPYWTDPCEGCRCILACSATYTITPHPTAIHCTDFGRRLIACE